MFRIPTIIGHSSGASVSSNLIHRTGAGRYGMHDLLRAYAIHLATTDDQETERRAALDRLLDFYQAAAVAAMDTLHPAESHYRPSLTGCTVPIPPLAGQGLGSRRNLLPLESANASASSRPAPTRT